MTVRVDAAGKHVAAGGVDVPAGRPEVPPEGGDDAAHDADIGLVDVGRGDDHGIPDDRVELCHGTVLSL
jgi:hypothetical protein